jgi:Methyltransferase domain
MYSINACMVCGEERRTIVSEYNRLVFIDSMWQNDLACFNYALCHGCGLVYATRRPDRKEYDYLYENFGEFLLRKPNAKTFNQASVPAEMAAEIDRAFLPWWEIRLASGPQTSIRKRLKYDLETALNFLSHLIQHVPLEGAKVLHVRAKGATLGDMLKRLLGARQVDLITLFPPHKYLAEKYDGIRAQACLDYEDFKIPFDEKYDLIIANHILLHMLDATETFEVYKSHLEEGGRLFLIGELADDELFRKRKNLLAECRPFHFQQFNAATVDRMLRRYGFEPQLVLNRGEGDSELIALATLKTAPAESPRIDRKELDARLSMYQEWREESLLSLPKARAEALYGDELKAIWERVESRGGFETSKRGTPKAFRPFPEANLSESDLVIAPAFVGSGKAARSWLGASLRTRLGSWLGARPQQECEPGTYAKPSKAKNHVKPGKTKDRARRAANSRQA